MSAFGMTSPCPDCPFRTDVEPYLRPERAEEIALTDGTFPCHKTTEHDDDGEAVHTGNEMFCPGFLIMREKDQSPNQMMRIGERLGLYDHTKLDMEAPVYGGPDEMIERYAEYGL